MSVSLIVAVSDNNVIGLNNQLPWHLPADLQYFRAHTLHKSIIMGRKTFDSIGRVLPERHNIVITHHPEKIAAQEGLFVVDSLKAAMLLAQVFESEIMVIGGAQIFQEALPLANRLYLTRVHANMEGDILFPTIGSDWKIISEERHVKDEKNLYDYTFFIYEKSQYS